jgi:hypothetical protein
MRRSFVVTSLLAAVMAFAALPAHAGVTAQVNINVGRRAPLWYAHAPRAYWQSGRGYGYGGGDADRRWDNDGARWRKQHGHRDGGQWGDRNAGPERRGHDGRDQGRGGFGDQGRGSFGDQGRGGDGDQGRN